MIRKVNEIRKENSGYRLVISAVNLLVLGLLTFHHYFTGTKGMQKAANLITEAVNRENSPPFKSVAARDECLPNESALIVYLWSGTVEGCVCVIRSGFNGENPASYFRYLDHTCFEKWTECLSKMRVNQTAPIPLYRMVNKKKVCYTK
jgi:hypothetical protein